MAVAPWQRQADQPRRQHDEGDLAGEVESCSAILRGLYCDETVEDGAQGEDADTHSAVDMASECMALLESIHCDDSGDLCRLPEMEQFNREVTEAPTETALLREFNALGDELQALMAALCAEKHEPESIASNHASIPPSRKSPSSVVDICTSPKMKSLTSRLSSRPTTQLMERRSARNRHSFTTRLQLLSDKIKAKTSEKSSPTRRLFNDAAFWRQHQSKSFRQHIARQSQARKREEEEKEKLTKAVEYRYRRVSKPCYPLAQKSRDLDVASPAAKISLPVVDNSNRNSPQSYAGRFSTSHSSLNQSLKSTAPDGRGLLCGVYLYGKRRKGMLYLTCSSMLHLKTHAKQRFKLPEEAAVVNLYREQVNNGGRKYLHRIESFSELRNGDLLCATTDSYQDMAILCTWMKQRQRTTYQQKKSTTTQEKTAEDRNGESACTSVAPKKKQASAQGDSLVFQPLPAAPIKLWDQNGRLVNIDQRLPL